MTRYEFSLLTKEGDEFENPNKFSRLEHLLGNNKCSSIYHHYPKCFHCFILLKTTVQDLFLKLCYNFLDSFNHYQIAGEGIKKICSLVSS